MNLVCVAKDRPKAGTLYRVVGDAVRKARDAKGMTQAAVADAIGTRTATISDIERGENLPDLPTLFRLSGTLDVSADQLLGLKQREPDIVAFTADGTELQIEVKSIGKGDPRVWESAIRKLLARPITQLNYDTALTLESVSFAFTPPASDAETERRLPEGLPDDLYAALRVIWDQVKENEAALQRLSQPDQPAEAKADATKSAAARRVDRSA